MRSFDGTFGEFAQFLDLCYNKTMNDTAVMDYIEHAPLAKLTKIARALDRRLAESDVTAAIAEGRRDIANSKIHTEAEIDQLLADRYGI